MNRIIIFLVLSIPLIIISWRIVFNIKGHGLYRLLSWECILWLFITNCRYWFDNFFSVNQIISWLLLIFSGYLIISGIILMKKFGKAQSNRNEKSLYQFEKTSELVDEGIFKYIRHPLYSSLLFLTWGIFFKKPSFELLLVSMLSSVFLYFTAIIDEKECIRFFGDKYVDYMKKSKRFVPYIF